MRVIGIDPGGKGAAVALSSKGAETSAIRLPFDKQKQLDIRTWWDWANSWAKPGDLILLEKPSVGGGNWGKTQIFNFGHVCGQINMAARMTGSAVRLVPPQAWQKMIHEGVNGNLKAKDRTMVAYKQFFPDNPMVPPKCRKADDNAVDALMLAVYGVLKYGGGRLQPWDFDLAWEV